MKMEQVVLRAVAFQLSSLPPFILTAANTSHRVMLAQRYKLENNLRNNNFSEAIVFLSQLFCAIPGRFAAHPE